MSNFNCLIISPNFQQLTIAFLKGLSLTFVFFYDNKNKMNKVCTNAVNNNKILSIYNTVCVIKPLNHILSSSLFLDHSTRFMDKGDVLEEISYEENEGRNLFYCPFLNSIR